MKASLRSIAFITSSLKRSSNYYNRQCAPLLKMSAITTNIAHNSGYNLLQNHLQRLRSSPTETLLLDGGTGVE